MAIPKVFVSSTCYDLAEERAQLERFISNYGFHPILSEHNGVYFDVDEHTHKSCINEVSHCDLMVLIISGRYGGLLKDGEGESITQAEHAKARELGIPVFTFVKSEVYNAQHYYKENLRNKGKTFAEEMHHPGIQKQSDAIPIFNFIDIVHRSNTNNGLETYSSFSDIEEHLKKQWAGLFHSFLQKRKEQDKVEVMASILDKLVGSSSKLEALVGSLHDKEVGVDSTKEVLHQNFIRSETSNFFHLIGSELAAEIEIFNEESHELESEELLLAKDEIIEASKVEPSGLNMTEYLSNLPLFEFKGIDKDGDLILCYRQDAGENYISKSDIEELEQLFIDGTRFSTPDMRRVILEDVYADYISSELD